MTPTPPPTPQRHAVRFQHSMSRLERGAKHRDRKSMETGRRTDGNNPCHRAELGHGFDRPHQKFMEPLKKEPAHE